VHAAGEDEETGEEQRLDLRPAAWSSMESRRPRARGSRREGGVAGASAGGLRRAALPSPVLRVGAVGGDVVGGRRCGGPVGQVGIKKCECGV
jgi:hypothetical protein